MSDNQNNDPDLTDAADELNAEFPGAVFDDSLNNHLRQLIIKSNRASFIKGLIKKIVFHIILYTVFSFGISLLFRKYNISIFTSMIYGLAYFLIRIILYKDHFYAIYKRKTFLQQFFKEEINE